MKGGHSRARAESVLVLHSPLCSDRETDAVGLWRGRALASRHRAARGEGQFGGDGPVVGGTGKKVAIMDGDGRKVLNGIFGFLWKVIFHVTPEISGRHL